jgi:hypothetical protein
MVAPVVRCRRAVGRQVGSGDGKNGSSAERVTDTDLGRHDVTTSEAPTATVKEVVETFLDLQERNRGTEMAEMLTDDAVLDNNVPHWRFQIGGGPPISAMFAESFPDGFRTTRHRWEPTPSGAVVEYDGWDVRRNLYFRHLALLALRDGRISRLTLYCTGEWDATTIERQRREAPMVDHDAQTGGTP